MKKLTQNKSNNSNNKSKANNNNNKKNSNQNNKNTQNNKKRSAPPPSSSDSHTKNKKKQKMSHHNNNNNPQQQQQMMMKQELLESLMALDDIPLPIPVILLNSITTHAGRSSLIQHMIDHCQGLSIAFLLSHDLVNDIVQNHQQQKSSDNDNGENKPCFSKIFALKEDDKNNNNTNTNNTDNTNNNNRSNRLNQLKNIGLKKNCPFDAIVTDVNTLDELTDILEYFDEISSQEQLNPEYSSPIYLDTIVSVANAHFLHQHIMMMNNKKNFNVRRDDAKLSLACDISSVILLNFSDLLNEEQMDQLVVKLSVINQVEHAHVIDTVKCNVDLFRVIGTRLIDNELNDRFLIESARFNNNQSQVVLAIENTAWNTTSTTSSAATTTTTSASTATATATATIKDKNQSTTAGASALLKKHKNIQVFSSLDQLKDVKKKHLTIVDRSQQQQQQQSNSLKTMEHFLENLIMEYKTFPSIEIEKIGVNDVGSMVEETLRQLLMMKYYGEYYDNDSDDDEEEEVNDNTNNNKKKRRAMSGKNSGKDIDDLEDGEDENDEYDSDDDEEEDRQGEEEDEEEEQKLKMDPEFFLKIHADDLESWVNDVQHLASVYARQFNNKKTVKITIRQQSLASNNNKNKKQQKPVVSTIEERFLFASYLGNGCGVRWFRSEEPNVQIELPPYSIGIRAKPSSVVYDLTRESSLAPHGLGIILIIQ